MKTGREKNMFEFRNLDEATRGDMVAAIDQASQSGNIYFSTRFNSAGTEKWVPLLREAAEKHNEHWLAFQIQAQTLMRESEGAKTPLGGYTTKHVPHTAAETIANGQFNRFYMLGLCIRAKRENAVSVRVYRAKTSLEPRSASEALVDTLQPVDNMISDLQDRAASLKHPLLGPNSGLSVELV
jgi:hypothetical protein